MRAATGPGRTGRPRSTAADDAILRATLDVVVEHGIRDASVDAIAARAHAGKDTIYRRWPHKDQLIRAALEHALDADLLVAGTGVVAEDLARYLEALDRLLVAGTTGTVLRELVAEAPRDPAVAVRLDAFRERHMAALVRILSGGGPHATQQPRVVAELALGWLAGRRLLGAADGSMDATPVRVIVERLLATDDGGSAHAAGRLGHPDARAGVTRSGRRRDD
jgi:AcrR family transcriptional regulator